MRFQPAILMYGTGLSVLGIVLLVLALAGGDNIRKRVRWTSSSS
jgi:hypothetical protein